jgi:hypothetical protein
MWSLRACGETTDTSYLSAELTSGEGGGMMFDAAAQDYMNEFNSEGSGEGGGELDFAITEFNINMG